MAHKINLSRIGEELDRVSRNSALSDISKRIHWIYFQGRSALAQELAANLDNIAARNPGWQTRLYDSSDIESFLDETYGPELLLLYKQIDRDYYAARSDFLRYLLLYALGGAYFDVKADVTRPLDSIVLPGDRIILSPYQGTHDSAVLSLPRDQQPAPLLGEYITWYLVFAAGHPVLRAVIDEVVRRMVNYSTFRDGVGAPATFWVTGPVAFNTAARRALAAHPHRLLLHEADAGIRFSIYSQPNLHQLRQGRHYSTLRRPLMLRGAVETAATIGFFRVFYFIRRRLQLHR